MPPFFNLPMGPSGHSVRHGKTRSPKADLTTLLKMRRATQVHHEHARLSDRANVSHVRLPMRHQNFDFREGVGRPARPHGALELGRRRHPTKMSRSTLHRSRPLSALDRTPDGAGAPRDQAPRRDRAPAKFTLVVPGDGLSLPCNVVWRYAYRIGVAFD